MKIFCEAVERDIERIACFGNDPSANVDSCKKCRFKINIIPALKKSRSVAKAKSKKYKPRKKALSEGPGPHILNLWGTWVAAYLTLLKKEPLALTEEQHILFEKLRDALMLFEASCRNHLTTHMLKLETWPIGVVLKAFGGKALSKQWFIDGLTFLLNGGKAVQLSIPKTNETKFRDFIKLAKDIEEYRKQRENMNAIPREKRKKSRIKAESFFDGPSETLRTRYHRDFPRLFESIILNFCNLYVSTPRALIPLKIIRRLPNMNHKLKFENELDRFEGVDFDRYIFEGLN